MSGLVFLPLLLLSAICRADLLFENTVTSQADAATNVNYRLPSTAKPTKYFLHLEPDLTKFHFTGQSIITLTVLENTSTLTLNAKNLTIVPNNVNVVGGAIKKPLAATGATMKDEEEFVVITFANTTLAKGTEYNLTINYSGELNDQKVGFYRSRYLTKNGTVKYIATTHFEPTRARLAFPCWDEPEYKASFIISITHLLNYTAISNMPQQGKLQPLPENKYTTSFLPSPPMSTYLVAFVVSDYVNTTNEKGTFRVWTKEDAANQAAYALKVGEDVIGTLDNYTGIKYSSYMPKMDQISIKDFTAGAMENWGLVTYRESALHYEEGVTTTASKQSVATIIAHEFAHQWFGNLVSPKWWEYIWLNEGFANYMQHFIMDKLEPSWRLMEYYVADSLQGKAFLFDAGEKTRPMNKAVSSPKEILALFDRVAYEKSGSIIRMMSYILTPDVLQKGLKSHLDKYKLSVADSDALFTSLQNATKEKWGGKELKEIMKEWVTKPGYPVLNVQKNKTGVFDISQERFTLYGTDDNTTWWIPLTYTDQSKRNFTFALQGWLKPEDKSAQITTNSSEKDWVIFNVDQIGYYRVNYDDDNWNLLSKYLKGMDFKNISSLSRAQLLDDALNLARTGRLNFTTALSLTTYLTQEADYIPWTTAFRNLNFVNSMMQPSKNYKTFQLYVRYILKQLTKDVTYKPKKEDDHVTKILRTNAMKWACKAQEASCTKAAKEAFDLWIKDPAKNRLDADLKNNILCAGLRTADEKTWNTTLKNLWDSTVDQDEKNGLLSIMGCSGTIKILKKFLMSSLETNSTIDFNIAVQAVISDNPEGVDLVLEVITTELEKIKTLDKADEKIKSCIETLGNAITNKDQFLQLTTFSAKVGTQPDLVQSTVEKATRNIEWLNTYGGVIDGWLVKHENEFNSASTIALTSLLAIISIFVTRFY